MIRITQSSKQRASSFFNNSHSVPMNSFFRRYPLVLPILMLVVASISGVILLAARVAISRHLRHLYLPWNLFLAWIPLGLALTVRFLNGRSLPNRWPLILTAAAWLIFFPNAPYILTDLVHLPEKAYRHYWADLMLILHFALTGLMLGFLSLHVMHSVVARTFGWLKGWCFVVGATALSGLGVYFGRFLRWNSWDVLIDPDGLAVGTVSWMRRTLHQPSEWILPLLFGSTTFLAYLLFSSLFRPSLSSEKAEKPPVPPTRDVAPSAPGKEFTNMTRWV
jgi:uncharacterized membrane protein